MIKIHAHGQHQEILHKWAENGLFTASDILRTNGSLHHCLWEEEIVLWKFQLFGVLAREKLKFAGLFCVNCITMTVTVTIANISVNITSTNIFFSNTF